MYMYWETLWKGDFVRILKGKAAVHLYSMSTTRDSNSTEKIEDDSVLITFTPFLH